MEQWKACAIIRTRPAPGSAHKDWSKCSTLQPRCKLCPGYSSILTLRFSQIWVNHRRDLASAAACCSVARSLPPPNPGQTASAHDYPPAMPAMDRFDKALEMQWPEGLQIPSAPPQRAASSVHPPIPPPGSAAPPDDAIAPAW